MDRQTLRDWVIRYNEKGLAGLSDPPKRGGAAPKLTLEEKAVLTKCKRCGGDGAGFELTTGAAADPAAKPPGCCA